MTNARTPLFFLHDSIGVKTISCFTLSLVRVWLRNILTKLGLLHLGFTFHLFRTGRCHVAYQRGVNLNDTKLLGNWKSDAVLMYLPAMSGRLNIAKALANA